jgi:hypothetical protein
MATISIPVDSEIVGELFLRAGPKANIGSWIENVVRDYLDRTADDGDWSDAYYQHRDRQQLDDAQASEYGSPTEGYHWTPLFLANGTRLCMEYKREKHYAIVKHGKISYNDRTFSPSELARTIANNTSRNAWRDLLVKRPADSDWASAEVLRGQQSRSGDHAN